MHCVNRVSIGVLLAVVTVSPSASQQSMERRTAAATTKSKPDNEEISQRILVRAKDLYGPSAPNSLTWTLRHAATTAEVRTSEMSNQRSVLQDSSEVQTAMMSMKGDVASGTVVLEEKDALYLDTRAFSVNL